ncbi:ComEA family DNA-binding protein [Sedimenticola sp.]|uniref:ComEA family DNA-binding protein n=1 Tax=Sedimenticola sp. TaxID=1940285 RepID=UPI002586E341|nr:helix-hairpin-helix domain-containing protein [Sedimenticola sp.]MCW8904567.1 helix-hairpin-helix domain-containing protein [Sedimenticola sp.]
MKRFKLLVGTALLLVSAVLSAGQVNINTATAEQIATELKGVGDSKAQAIVAYRTQNGAFKTADELAMVKGIGEKTVAANRENILIGKPGK